MSKVYVFDHPLIQHKIANIRMKDTSTKDFRHFVKEISMLMTYEATRDLPLEKVDIETPICRTEVNMLKGPDVAVVPILRAGLGMVDGVLDIIPNAKVGHIGLFRDPDTHLPQEYYCKMPEDIDKRKVIITDPMLATGGSAVAAVDSVKARGAKDIVFMCMIAAPEGIDELSKAHPDIDIYIASKDEGLNEKAYIVPGLGDAGDRIFGTK